jgi:hypothetical protein
MDKFQSVAGELYRTAGVTLAVTRPSPGIMSPLPPGQATTPVR